MLQFKSCYYKCLKHFCRCLKNSSVTNRLFELRLPSFDILIHSYNVGYVFLSVGTCDDLLLKCLLRCTLWY